MSSPEKTRLFLLTPAGHGAIALLRLEGPKAVPLAESCFRPRRMEARFSEMPPGKLVYGDWLERGEVIDDVLACRLDAAGWHVEISCHGGPHVVERIVRSLLASGVEDQTSDRTPSFPWEPQGLIDRLTLDRLPFAKTTLAVRFLLAQRRVLPDALRAMLARIRANTASVGAAALPLLRQARAARVLLEGMTLVIAGPANAGKSTLFNALVGRDAALTAPHPGTTRDWIEAEIDLGGFPVTLVDTAGFHDTDDGLDVEAIRRTTAQVARADLVLVVMDGTDPGWPRRLAAMTRRLRAPHAQRVLNKVDARLPNPSQVTHAEPADAPWISARTGEGLNALVTLILERMGLAEFDAAAPTAFTDALETALNNLSANPSDGLLDEIERLFFPLGQDFVLGTRL